MNLEQKIMAELKTAMLAKDEKTVRTLRAIKAAIIVAKTAEGAKGEIMEAEELKLLQKMVKQRKESLDIFRQQNRNELAEKEQEEITVIERFLPQQLNEEEIRRKVEQIIQQSGATSAAAMGKVMGLVNKELSGQADGKTISAIVKELLTKK